MKALNKRMATAGRPTLVGIYLLFGLTLAGCEPSESPRPPQDESSSSTASSDEEPGDFHRLEAPGVAGSVVLAPEVFELSPAMLDDVTLREDQLEVASSAPRQLRERMAGDVLIFTGDGGFWEYIERVEQDHARVIYHTRTAKMTEVIREGRLAVDLRSDSLPTDIHQDTKDGTRRQALLDDIDPLTVTKAFDIEKDLGSANEFQFADNAVELQTSGTLDFRPGFKLLVDIANFQINEVEFTALGELDLDATVNLSVNEGQSSTGVQPQVFYREIPLCSGNLGYDITCEDGRPTFSASVLGQELKVSPKLRAGFSWQGQGSGTLTIGMQGNGNVKAGYAYLRDGGNEEIAEDDFSATASDPEYTGSLDLEYKNSLELGLTLSLAGDKLIEAVPFHGVFSSEAALNPPLCDLSTRLKVSGKILRYGFLGSGTWPLYSDTPLDAHHPVDDIPGCTSDTTDTAQSCRADGGDCGAGEVCNQGYCVEDTPLQLSVNWTDENADLDLIVEYPAGEFLQESNDGDAQAATAGWIAVRSAGGTHTSTDSGKKLSEVALFRRIQEGQLYRFWVTNKSDLGEDTDITYNVQIFHRDNTTKVMEGVLSGKQGTESVRYVYNSSPTP